jgi:epoxyqueuosine reductase
MLGMPYTPSPHTRPSKRANSSSASSRPELSDGSGAAAAPAAKANRLAKLGSYASGSVDYHDLIRESMNQICSYLAQQVPGSSNRGVVDTAPLMERDFAQLAGIGWIGKNTLLLHRQMGSYFFLAAVLTDIELEADNPFPSDHCGTCTACLDACPTDAFEKPHVLNASKCISYLTIEHRGTITAELSEGIGEWLFGCDVCQMVCPWNRKVEVEVLPPFQHLDLDQKSSLEHWLQLDDAGFRTLYRKTPFWRTKLAGMQRNAMIVAANTNRLDLVPLIEPLLQSENSVLAQTALESLARLNKGSSHL